MEPWPSQSLLTGVGVGRNDWVKGAELSGEGMSDWVYLLH